MGRRILVAWELAGGPAHVRRLLPIADELTARGHSVTLAVRAVEATRRALGRAAYPLLPAPAWRGTAPRGFIASSYAEVLQQAGYGDPTSLNALVSDWLDRFTAAWPDIVVADFAPTAMLAARIAGLPLATVGNGYALPPLQTPLPNMRPWTAVDPVAIATAEAGVLSVINTVLASHGKPPLARLAALFDAEASFLCSFPELDHYLDRGEAEYFGVIYDDRTGEPPTWPDGHGERVFATLDARTHNPVPLLEALDRLGLPSVMQVTGLAAEAAAALSRGRVRVTGVPVHLPTALEACDIVVCQGLGTVAAALVAGRPVLVLPVYVEQMMTLHRVARQGYGLGVPADADAETTGAALRRLLDDPSCRRAAGAFSLSYAGYQPGLALTAISEELIALPVLA